MGDQTGPVAARLRRPSWRDPRLLVGLVLVAASVALGSWAVTAAQATTGVYVTRSALTPGDTVGPDQLTVVQVKLRAEEAAHYVVAGASLPEGAVVLRQVATGELLPRAALGDPRDLDLRPVPVSLDTEPSASVVAGSTVDVWTVPPAAGTSGAAAGAVVVPPVLLASGVTVSEVVRPTGSFASGGRTVVHVLVAISDLPQVLTAISGAGTMQVIHVPGTGG